MKIFLFLILLLLSCKSAPDSKLIENQEDKALIKKWIVTPDSGLNLRDAPSRKAKSIRLLPRGTMVNHKQIPENEKPDTIEDQKGKWFKVDIGNESGWVFDVYLSEPVFSPSGDKFYFVTVKDPNSNKIVSSRGDFYCRNEYIDLEKRCKIEIRNKENTEIIKEIKHENIIAWYDDKTIISRDSLKDGGQVHLVYHLIDINYLTEKNLFTKFRQYLYLSACVGSKHMNECIGIDLLCILYDCLKLERSDGIINYTYTNYENTGAFRKEFTKRIPIRMSQNFGIKDFTEEEILNLKHPYTGNIEFSVDKRNYLLHVPTGKVTEVREK